MTTDTDPVSRFLDAVSAGTGIPADLFHPDAVLDATIPDFRFAQHGAEHVAGQLSSWFADPGAFQDLARTPLPGGGELVRFVLQWDEGGDQMAAHQVHVIEVTDGLIRRQEVWCGGRWDSARQADIAAAMH